MSREKSRINRVTTRSGDSGETSLADGTRLAKSDPQIHAIGAVDELNSFIGLLVVDLRGSDTYGELITRLDRLQQELFDLGAHLATAGATSMPDGSWLDDAVAALNATLPPLTEFVIPNGTRESVLCHVARTVCRRAERHCWEIERAAETGRYLNRLSDLLFVMARTLNHGGDAEEAQWRGLPDDSER